MTTACVGGVTAGLRLRWAGGRETADWRVADWLVPLEVTRGAALAWVAAVGGKVAAASRDRLVAVKLGRERDGGDEGQKTTEKDQKITERDTKDPKTTSITSTTLATSATSTTASV